MNQNLMLNQIKEVIPNYCDKCGSKYNETDVEFVETNENKATCKLTCANCRNTYLIHVSSPIRGMLTANRTPFKAAITTKEIAKFSKGEKIQGDEVLDIYDSMKEVKTIEDFNKLFKS